MAGRAAARKASPAPQAGRTNIVLWWGGLGCGAVIVLSPGTAVLLSALLAPVLLLALLPEESGEGRGGRIMRAGLLFGLAAGINPLRTLWVGGGSIDVALALVRQPAILFTAWTAIAASWLVGELAGMALRLAADLSATTRRRGLTAAVAELEGEWGPSPSRFLRAPRQAAWSARRRVVTCVFIAFCTFSNARTSIWRTRSREMP